jgi:hypothetical protein
MRSQSLLARALLFILAALLALAATSCSTGPAPPRPGTPAFNWAAAKENYRAGDLQKTDAALVDIIRTDNEFAARARAWDIVLSAGLAQGFAQLADNFEAGGRANRANPMPFHKQVTALRSYASAASLELVETSHAFLEKDKAPNVLLAFEFPSGSAAEPGSLKRVAGGILVPDAEREALQTSMLQRGVLLGVCRAVGSADDPAKAQEKFKGEVLVPRDVFLLAVAKALQEQADLFTSNKLDQPTRQKMMSQQALDVLHAIPETKETKALTTKIEASIKKIRGA